MTSWEHSKSQVRKAGRTIREYWRSPTLLDEYPGEEQIAIVEAYEVVSWYRKSVATPMLKTRIGLTSFVETTGIGDAAAIAQRLKRLPRIMGKLDREPSMQLTTMQDIGGCRVVVPTVTDVRRLQAHIRKRWRDRTKRVDDYIDKPRATGYRAVHVVVDRDDRPVEVQLRSHLQHLWADHVERHSRAIGHEMKWGVGPPSELQSFASLAEVMAHLDTAGVPIPASVTRVEEIFG